MTSLDPHPSTSGSVRMLVVSATEEGARAIADRLTDADDITVQATAAGRASDAAASQTIDCLVDDRTERVDAEIPDPVRANGDVVYVPLLEFTDWVSLAPDLADDRTVPVPKPSTNRLDDLGPYLRETVHQCKRTRLVTERQRLHRFFWELTDEVMEAPTEHAILERVCKRVANGEHFEGAWVWNRGRDDGVRTKAGIATSRIGDLREAFDTDSATPWGRAARERTGHCHPETTDEALEGDRGPEVWVFSIPLVHRGIVYGVLNVLPDSGVVRSDWSVTLELAASFGKAVGQALAAAEMQTQSETVQQAIEQSDPAIAILDEEGSIEYVNRAFESVYDHPKSEAIDSTVDLLVPETVDSGALLDRVRDGTKWREEIIKYGGDGRRFYADLSITAVPVDGGTKQKFVAVASDITSLKEREQRLRVLNRVLRHNLRNDMASIMARANLIAEGHADQPPETAAEIWEHASELVATSEKVRNATNALDDTVDRQEIRIRELLRQVTDDLSEAHSGTVTVEVPSEIVVEANWRQLELVFSNLIENALEHGGTDPTVEVALAGGDTHEGTICITVRDDGPGIPQYELDVLERGEETALEHGSGLGLWLVDAAVTTLGGELSFLTDDSGTTVRVDIPGVRRGLPTE